MSISIFCLATNVWLKKVGITNNELCTICHNENETVTHLLGECVNAFRAAGECDDRSKI